MGGFLPVVVGLEGVDTGHSTHGEGAGLLRHVPKYVHGSGGFDSFLRNSRTSGWLRKC